MPTPTAANQKYAPKTGACGLDARTRQPDHGQFERDLIQLCASYKVGNLRPFLLGGIGFFITIPGPTPYGNNTSIRAVYDGGGGVDWRLSQHLGIRCSPRQLLQGSQHLTDLPGDRRLYLIGEPMGGVYYRF